MGEIADMMLDGTLCEGCGEIMDDMIDGHDEDEDQDEDDAPGYPRRCAACGGDDEE